MKKTVKRVFKAIGILFVVLITAVLCFYMYLFLTAPNVKINFDVNITKIYLDKEPFLDDEGYEVLRGNDKEEFRENPDDYISVNYVIEYYSNKKLKSSEKHVSLGVFFDVTYPNALNDLIIDHSRHKDFGFIHTPGKVNTYCVRVTVKRGGYTEKEILEMAQDVNIKVRALQYFNMTEMMTR